MATEVDDELEKYAAKPSTDDDELEKYAKKPGKSGATAEGDYVSTYRPGSAGLEKQVEQENLTPRMRSAISSGAATMPPVTRFETEHTPRPEDTGWYGRLKQGAGDVGRFVIGLASAGPVPLPVATPGMISDIAAGYAGRAVPNIGQEGLAGARSTPYNILATTAGAAGVDPTGMETSAEHGDPWGVATHAAGQLAPVAAAELGRIPAVQRAAGKIGTLGAETRRGWGEKLVEPLVYEGVGETAADRRLGIKPESGIVAEGHFGTKQGMLDAAKQRTADLKIAANDILRNHPNANVQIDVEPFIDQAIDEAIVKAEKTAGSTERLENLRTALKTKYGPTSGTPLEMNNLKTDIQEAANELGAYKNTQPVEASAASAMKNVAKLIKDEVNAKVPEAKKFNERMANSIDAQAGLQRGVDRAKGESILGGFHEGTTSRLLNRTVGSAPVRSGLARILNIGNVEGIPAPMQPLPPPGPPAPFRPPAAGPQAPPTVPPQFQVQPIGSPAGTTQLGARGAAGVRQVQALPAQAASLIPPVQPTVPPEFRTEVPGTQQNEFQLGPRGEGGTVVPPVQGGVRGLLPGPAPKGLLPPIATELPPPGTAELAHPELFPRKPSGVPAMSNVQRGAGGRMQKVFTGERVPETVGRTAEGGPIKERTPAPATIAPVLNETGWTYEGRNNLGQHTFREPGSNIKLNLFDRDMNPEFVRRKIAEKEAQYGAEAKKKEITGEEPVPYTRPLPIPPGKIAPVMGVTTPSVLHHELGHAIVGSLNGFETNGIVTNRFPGMSERNATAAALFPIEQFYEHDGLTFKKDVLVNNAEKIADLFAAGAAANELIDGIPRDKNPGLFGDRRVAKKIFNALDIPEEKHAELFSAAIDRAKEKLSGPGIADLMRSEAKFREDNLPVEYHFSKNRVNRIMQEVRRLQNEPAQTGSTAADFGRRGEGGGETVAGREGLGTQEPRKAPAPSEIKPFKPPKNIYEIRIEGGPSGLGGAPPPRTITVEALDRRKAFELAQKQNPGSMQFTMIGERKPQVGPPFEMAPFEKGAKGEEEPGPLRGMVQDKDAAARVNRKLNRKEGIGDPKSPALVVHDAEGKPYVFGNASTDQLLEKWQGHLDPATIKTWREWYPDISKQFEQAYGKGKQAASKMMAWLGSQQNTSPSGGLMNVERATDILSGQRKIKSAGIAENNIMSMLQGKVPQEGYGAKLHDFVDSAFGRKSRTVMGDDPRGGAPAVVDVHGARGMGFVDQTLKDFVAKKFGPEAAGKLTADLTGAPTETQYEYGSEKMNRVADELNKRGFMGGGWTPYEVQAVDWAATIKQFGREPELPNSIFDKNTRRMSYEVKFGQNSPYEKRFPNLGDLEYAKSMGITRDVAQHAMNLIAKESGGHVLRNVYGPGGWMSAVAPAAGTEILASPEAAERATNMLGYLLQQDAVITSRPQLSGGGHFYEVLEPKGVTLRDPEKITQFWNAFREVYPKAEGFMPVETPNGSGIRILKVRGHFSAKDVAALDKAASHAAERVKMDAINTSHGPADVYMAQNDWKANPDGKGYLQRIKEIGRPGIQGRLRNELAPAVERAIQQAFRKHAPEEARGGNAPQAGKTVIPPLKRAVR